MNNIQIINKQGKILNMELIFSFTCKDNGKTYVALNNKNDIFEPNSQYANIDIFEITNSKGKYFYISDIPQEDWTLVKKTLQFNVFANMN